MGQSWVRSAGSAVVVVCSGCSASVAIEHEAALIGTHADAVFGDDAADLHARWTDAGAQGPGEILQVEVATGVPLTRLGLPDTAVLRDVTERRGDARILLLDRPTAQAAGGRVTLATATSADDVRVVDGQTLYDAVLTESGIVVAQTSADTGCSLVWLDDAGTEEAVVTLDRAACGDSLTLVSAPDSGEVGWTSGELSGIVTPSGGASWSGGGTLAAWDPFTAALVVAEPGSSELRAWTADGEESWYTDIGQPVVDLDDLGGIGALAVATRSGTGGRIVVLDGFSGDALAAIDLPLAAVDLTAATPGTHIGIGLPDEFHIFAVDTTEVLQ